MAAVRSELLVLVLTLAVSLGSAASEQRNITAEPGKDVILPCGVPNNKNIIVVEWKRPDLGEEYVLLCRDKQFDPEGQHPSYQNRVDLQDRQMKDGDVSLILKDVTPDDGGTYECRVVQKGEKGLKTFSIILSVSPAGNQAGRREGGGEEEGGEEEGGGKDLSVGLIVCLSVVFIVVLVAGFLYKRRRACLNQPPAEPAAAPQHV